MLSIGGNHLIHALRRNVNIKILLFNNQIYGLTKGQYSPTSEPGKITKSTPVGSIDEPFNPISLALGAEATFVAHDMDRKHMQAMFRRAHEHKGAALVEIYQNCNVFNDGAFAQITKRDKRGAMLIDLVHGEPIRFGEEKERGLAMDANGRINLVEVADVGETNLLVHDEASPDPAVAFAISRLATAPTMPTPVGVFRAVDRPEYAQAVNDQVDQVTAEKGAGTLEGLFASRPTWTV